MTKVLVLLSLAVATFLAACGGGSLVHKKPEGDNLNQAMTELWARDIRRVAKSGDWILTRSYSVTGDAIVGVTLGESFSHAALYDAERDTVVEAIRPVVREVPLQSLLDRNRYAVVVRPLGLSAQQRRDTIPRARAAIGANFDYSGMLGIDDESRFYCSELVSWASQMPDAPIIVTPADLYERAEVVYLSGARDEVAVQRAAVAQREPAPLRVAARR